MVRSVVPTHTALLEGVRVAIPGEPVSLGDPSRALAPLWSPSLICSRSTAADASAATLRAVVASTVLAQAAGRATLVQLSGGLDSSIVLSCLSRGLSSDRLIAFTMATRHAGGDERSYARIAADAFGVRLASRFAPERPIDHRGLLAIDHGVRPYLYGLDAAFEGAVAAVAEASGAELVMTGQGGDAVFFELPSPAVFVDRVRRDGLRALGTAAAVADAERCDVSWWSLASAVLRDRLGLASPTPSPVAPELLSPEARDMLATGVPTHPWIVQAQALPPGRRVQIEAIANGQILFAPRPGPDPLPIAHPLLAQPVVDHVLSLSTAELCFGVGDRALARAAFAQRLPGPILARRVKGEASSHYSRAVSADRADLREMLLDGPLQAAGLLDRAAVEQAIAPHTLVFGDAFRALSLHASLSAWAGYWRDTR